MPDATDPRLAGREFQTGEVLFREGEPGDVMFVIRQGAVRISKEIDGNATVLADLSEGDFVGEVGVIRGGIRPTTAVATAPTRCLEVDAGMLEDLVTGDQEIAVRFIRGLADRLAATHEMLGLVGYRDSRTRVCMAIIRHAEASEDVRPEGVWIPKRLGDIGDEVSVSKVELGEISKHFLRLQLLRIKRDGILVPDVSRLYGFVKSGDV